MKQNFKQIFSLQRKFFTNNIIQSFQNTVCDFNNYKFRINKQEKINLESFLESFSSSTYQELKIFLKLEEGTIEERLKLMKSSLNNIMKNKINKENESVIPLKCSKDFQAFSNGKYLRNKCSLTNLDNVFIVDYDFNKQSLIQRGIDIDISNYYSSSYQKLINDFLENTQEKKIKKIPNFNYKNSSSNIYNISKFITENSNLKLRISEKIDMSFINRRDINDLLILQKSANLIKKNNFVPIFVGDDMEKIMYEGFSTLKKLTSKFNSKAFNGIVTNLKDWKFIMFINNGEKVETIDNFKISNSYKFHIFDNSISEDDNSDMMFSLFISISEKLVNEQNSLIKNI